MLDEKDSNKFLYHYTKADTAASYILRNQSLKLNSYLGTNDPKEKKNWVFDFGTNNPSNNLDGYDRGDLSRWLSRELKEKTFLSCFSRDGSGLTGNRLTDLNLRGYCKPRMWAQYADNHQGVCLVFDRKRIEQQLEKQFSNYFMINGPVEYVDRSVIHDPDQQQFMINVDCLDEEGGKESYPMRHLQTYYRKLFFEKMTDWSAEAEWRCVVFSDSTAPLFLNYEDSLIGMVFGDETSEQDRIRIRQMTPGIYHSRLQWKNCSPWYDFNDGFRDPLRSPF